MFNHVNVKSTVVVRLVAKVLKVSSFLFNYLNITVFIKADNEMTCFLSVVTSIWNINTIYLYWTLNCLYSKYLDFGIKFIIILFLTMEAMEEDLFNYKDGAKQLLIIMFLSHIFFSRNNYIFFIELSQGVVSLSPIVYSPYYPTYT